MKAAKGTSPTHVPPGWTPSVVTPDILIGGHILLVFATEKQVHGTGRPLILNPPEADVFGLLV